MARAWLGPSLGVTICLGKMSWTRTSILKKKLCFCKCDFWNSGRIMTFKPSVLKHFVFDFIGGGIKPSLLAVFEEEDCQVTVMRPTVHSLMLPGCSGKCPLF